MEDRLPEAWINEDDVLVNYMICSPDFGVDIGSYHAKAKRWVWTLCTGGWKMACCRGRWCLRR